MSSVKAGLPSLTRFGGTRARNCTCYVSKDDAQKASCDRHGFKTQSRESSRRAALAMSLLSTLGLPPDSFALDLSRQPPNALEALAGGPYDLVYPESWEGIWNVESILRSVSFPDGPEMVENVRAVRSTQHSDEGKITKYSTRFCRNRRGDIVLDRKFTTASFLSPYEENQSNDFAAFISWNIDMPNHMMIELRDGTIIDFMVTKRSEIRPESNRLETSEFSKQLIESPGKSPYVRASQIFTKYLWRTIEESSSKPEVIATQILTEYRDFSAFRIKPTVQYTYNMALAKIA